MIADPRQMIALLVRIQELEVETERLHTIISVQADSLASITLRLRAEDNAAGPPPTPGPWRI